MERPVIGIRLINHLYYIYEKNTYSFIFGGCHA